jgi:hypothetical protein
MDEVGVGVGVEVEVGVALEVEVEFEVEVEVEVEVGAEVEVAATRRASESGARYMSSFLRGAHRSMPARGARDRTRPAA